ncbi:3-hydroxyacyl-ACP dehydratase FabZ [Acetobacterium bakii]|uniref:Beta-hydroxyacyl-ACP dehydratase n=1 Tax=Acetobacterium bakii TaxID=52689 RepID=A0A0L6TZQ4_9FIRM|nr:3-hydroxyacyl-ACP dehydratase FabZ [Acetobacterium bakii]KNZ41562.1 beta-hydroxyacyl-ACP dehydratase [Acetobacterium bakii]
MKRDEIKTILPHREPMLLVDEAEKIDDTTATGRYTVTGDEFFLQGHFPGNPVVPGVILCEIMAQTCCVLLAEISDVKKTPYFTGLNKVKFKEKVLPGDTIEITCSITNSKPPFYFAKGSGSVNGKIAVVGEFSFALMD